MRDLAAKEKRSSVYPRPENFPNEADVEAARAAGEHGRPAYVEGATATARQEAVQRGVRDFVARFLAFHLEVQPRSALFRAR